MFKDILDKIYNGAWENLELSKKSKKSLGTAGAIVGIGLIISIGIIQNNKK